LTNIELSARIERVLPKSGPVAQLGARFHGMEEVIGSIPIRSTKISRLESVAYRERPKRNHLRIRTPKIPYEISASTNVCSRRNKALQESERFRVFKRFLVFQVVPLGSFY
jgi:hypothetical protein